jgi:hypothetical protein
MLSKIKNHRSPFCLSWLRIQNNCAEWTAIRTERFQLMAKLPKRHGVLHTDHDGGFERLTREGEHTVHAGPQGVDMFSILSKEPSSMVFE